MSTQMLAARKGIITPQMRIVAEKEFLEPELIRQHVASGTIVIPANIHHTNLVPCGIGRILRTKVNANIGNSSLSSCCRAELDKLAIAIKYGADTVMDLSTGSNITGIRQALINKSVIPLGTVPIYESVARVGAENISKDVLLQVILEQAQQGVDYMTIHAGLLKKHLPSALKRKLGIVSRGGAIIAAWMKSRDQENPFYENFDAILDICRQYDVTISLGDGLRPGCIADASDAAQFAELATLGELAARCRDAGVQVMVEGPGHVPCDQIEMNMKREQELCGDAPFYILGPVVTDCAPGYDHLTAAMGGMMGAFYGAAMLCYVTPKEHIGLPDADDVARGLTAFKIAAHAADIALHRPHCQDMDDQISDARAVFDWEKQFDCAIEPERPRAYRAAALAAAGETPDTHGTEFCTMCGPDFCSIRLSAKLKSE
ncbi:MAG: phosphomethylpyrimidine synthase ThiC [Lentisphaeria bacterium]|nr:phosphomethylpyrimidine synthase ThiC [Lentisphaeria bacterium]